MFTHSCAKNEKALRYVGTQRILPYRRRLVRAFCSSSSAAVHVQPLLMSCPKRAMLQQDFLLHAFSWEATYGLIYSSIPIPPRLSPSDMASFPLPPLLDSGSLCTVYTASWLTSNPHHKHHAHLMRVIQPEIRTRVAHYVLVAPPIECALPHSPVALPRYFCIYVPCVTESQQCSLGTNGVCNVLPLCIVI